MATTASYPIVPATKTFSASQHFHGATPRPDGYRGPPDLVGLTRWLTEWEEYFAFNPGSDGGMGERGRVVQAGNSTRMLDIRENWLEDYKIWWDANRTFLLTWEEFSEELRVQLLGRDWYVQAVRRFCNMTQQGLTLTEYFGQLYTLAGVLKKYNTEPDHDKWLKLVFKQYMVFRSDPVLWEERLKNDAAFRNRLTNDSNYREMLPVLRERDSGGKGTGTDSGTGTRPIDGGDSGGGSGDREPQPEWLASGIVGANRAAQTRLSSHFQFLPDTAGTLGRVAKVDISYNEANGQLDLKQLSIVFSSDSNPVVVGDENRGSLTKSLQVAGNDYISAVQVSWNSSGIASLHIATANGRTESVGRASSDNKEFKAPSGRSIVGFQLLSNGERFGPGALRWRIGRVGVIYGPRG